MIDKMKSLRAIIVCVAILFALLETAAAKRRAAMMDLGSSPDLTEIAHSLSSMIRHEVTRIRVHHMLDRENMVELLKEHALQASGCTSSACAVEAGQILDCDMVFIGVVAVSEPGLEVHIERVVVAKGKVDWELKAKVKKQGELQKVAEEIAAKIAAEEYEVLMGDAKAEESAGAYYDAGSIYSKAGRISRNAEKSSYAYYRAKRMSCRTKGDRSTNDTVKELERYALLTKSAKMRAQALFDAELVMAEAYYDAKDFRGASRYFKKAADRAPDKLQKAEVVSRAKNADEGYRVLMDLKSKQATGSSRPFLDRIGYACFAFKDKIWIIGGKEKFVHEHNAQDLYYADVWCSSNGRKWKLVKEEAPFEPRLYHECVAMDDKIFLIGGRDGVRGFDDVWISKDGSKWTLATTHTEFSSRYDSHLVTDDDSLWLFGGRRIEDEYTSLNDMWGSNDGRIWRGLDELPGERTGYAGFAHAGKIWFIGGIGNDGKKSDVWFYSDEGKWRLATADGGFGRRTAHTAVAFKGKMWLIGGSGGLEIASDVWWSANGIDWTEATHDAGFTGRMGHTCLVFRDKIWVIGGHEEDYTPLDDIWCSEDGVNWGQVQSD